MVAKQAGISDRGILCRDCEARFGKWDDHGFRVLTKSRGDDYLIRDRDSGIPLGVALPEAKYDRLKLVVLSVLWRASVSSLPFFSHVKLGPHEDRIRALLESGEVPGAEAYSTLLFLPIGETFPGVMLPPWHHRVDHVRFYRLYLPHIIILVKVDQRPTPGPLAALQMTPDAVPVLAFMPHRGSAEARTFSDLHAFMKKHDLFEKP